MKLFRLFSCLFCLGCTHPQASTSKTIQKSESFPVKSGTTTYNLNALFLTEGDSSRRPLIILSHGTPFSKAEAPQVVPENLLDQAREFLKLGFAVLIVERRGFGRSKEKLVEMGGDCEHRDQIASGQEASMDILGAIDYAQANLDIDPTQIVLVGHSSGGFITIFASSYQHPGVQAAINIEGGRGFDGKKVCSEQALLDAFKFAGQTSRIPTLWIYTENDHIFPPKLAEAMVKAFTSTGGRAEFLMLPPFQNEGHKLFDSSLGIPIWQPLVKKFLHLNTKERDVISQR